MQISNPFKERHISSSNTFLLNYGEQNLTLFNSLTRPFAKKKREDITAQLTILKKMRLQAYNSQQNNEDTHQRTQRFITMDDIRNQNNQRNYWNQIPKIKPQKTFLNPYTHTSYQSQYGSMAPQKEEIIKPYLIKEEADNERKKMRREFLGLKTQVKNRKENTQGTKSSKSSVTELYKQKYSEKNDSMTSVEQPFDTYSLGPKPKRYPTLKVSVPTLNKTPAKSS